MDDERTPSDRDSVPLLWTNSTLSSNNKHGIHLSEPSRESCSGSCEKLELNVHLSESAPDLVKKSDSTHYVALRRLCKSADTLSSKLGEHPHFDQLQTGEELKVNVQEKRYVPYEEFEISRAEQRKCPSGSKAFVPLEKRILHIGNLSQRVAPLDYTLCLADYKTKWNLSENSRDSKPCMRLSINTLAKHLSGVLIGYVILIETGTGSIIAEFTNFEDMDHVVRLPLAKIFGTKVKSWRISRRCPYSQHHRLPQSTQLSQQYHHRQHSPSTPSRPSRHYLRNYNCHSYRRYLIAPDIPDTVPAPEIQNALRFQGLCTGQVWRHMPCGFSIEVLRPCDYESLRRDGVNFFNVATFPVYPSTENSAVKNNADLDTRYPYNVIAESKIDTQETAQEIPFAILHQTQHHENIQCFKCQRYGHKAIYCKYWTRCVRCGGKHKVSDCNVPMSAASCCLCKGSHHAASHDCPVHYAHANAVQVSFTMARTSANLKSSSFATGGNIW